MPKEDHEHLEEVVPKEDQENLNSQVILEDQDSQDNQDHLEDHRQDLVLTIHQEMELLLVVVPRQAWK